MSLEQTLQRLDGRIQEAQRTIETAYATRVSDERKDALFARLDALLWSRPILRQLYAEELRWQILRWQILRASIEATWTELTRRVGKIVEEFMPAFRELEAARKRSRPAFWRGLYVADRGARMNPPKLTFATALPANRRPVLPGHMKQKGRG